ncbi:MAG: hypothetical protein HYV28_01465 [Ignavibacteriales bacterium]|nr:hypothetical protein [Ignavibacteriales bacterium]
MKKNPMNLQKHRIRLKPLLSAMLVLLFLFPAAGMAQNNAVQWSSQNNGHGSAVSSSSNKVWSNVGQSFNGQISQNNTLVSSGFLANNTFSTVTINQGQNVSLAFDGVNDYVEIPHNVAFLPPAITIECWAKSNTATWNTTGALISKREAFILHPNEGTKQLQFYIHMPDRWIYTIVDLAIDITQWHHFAATYDQNNLKLYIDGVFASSYFYQSALTGGAAGSLYIGSDKDGGNRYFNGQIDEVRFWNYARSASEISSSMSNTLLNPASSGLIAYYHMNDGTGSGTNTGITTVTDATLNGYNGTLNNFALSGSTSNFVTGFTAPTAPGLITLVSPANNAVSQPIGTTISWTALSTATSYQLQVSRDSNFTSNDKDTTISGTSLLMSNLSYAEQYYYRVRGINDVATGSWNTAWKFTTMGNISLAFDGSNDFVTFGNNASLKPANAVTLEAWVKPGISGNEQFILSSGHDAGGLNGYHLVLQNNHVYFWMNNYTTEIISPGSLNVGTWYHIAATYSSSAGAKMYINGVLVGADASPANAISYDNNPVTMGVLANYPIYFFGGLLDEVRIWSVERTAQEILDNMNNVNLNKSTSGLLAYYQYDQGIAGGNNTGVTTLNNGTATSADGTLNNFALNSGASNWVEGKSFAGKTTVTITAFLQGLTTGAAMISDTVSVLLKNPSTFATIDSAKVLLNTSGNGSVDLQNNYSGSSYYIVVKHRNSIETWSATSQAVTESALSYNFTTAASKAYGSNLVQMGSNWCIYSGDVNQDGFVDFTDLTLIDNDAYNFSAGYLSTDLNGDLFIDFTDLTLCDNNAYNFVGVIAPTGVKIRHDTKPVKQVNKTQTID